MKVLSICIFILIIFFSLCCKNENEGRHKKEETTKLFLYSSLDFINRKNAMGGCFDFQDLAICHAGIPILSHNIKSIKVYKNNVLSFESPRTSEDAIPGRCGASEAYSFDFQQNNLSLGSLVNYHFKGNYCGVKLKFANGITEKYEMSFNGDLNTFTEINAGEYRFVAVR